MTGRDSGGLTSLNASLAFQDAQRADRRLPRQGAEADAADRRVVVRRGAVGDVQRPPGGRRAGQADAQREGRVLLRAAAE